MATCATLGQAAGTAMSYCLKNSVIPAALSSDKIHLHQLQQILLRQDQALLGVQNEDDKDIARSAYVRSSGETPEGPAASVIDGFNRNVTDGNTHQWQAVMKDGGAWIELSWKKGFNMGTIELTFDTGLNRYLRISPELSVFQDQMRGPQPETVSDYRIEAKYKGNFVFEKNCTGNYLRKVIHRFETIQADSIRITVQKTNGDELARIFEIRCYQ
jgi:hypothetical protein